MSVVPKAPTEHDSASYTLTLLAGVGMLVMGASLLLGASMGHTDQNLTMRFVGMAVFFVIAGVLGGLIDKEGEYTARLAFFIPFCMYLNHKKAQGRDTAGWAEATMLYGLLLIGLGIGSRLRQNIGKSLNRAFDAAKGAFVTAWKETSEVETLGMKKGRDSNMTEQKNYSSYNEVPWHRREGILGIFSGLGFLLWFLGLAPFAFLVLLFPSVVSLSGRVFSKKKKQDGTLREWNWKLGPIFLCLLSLLSTIFRVIK